MDQDRSGRTGLVWLSTAFILHACGDDNQPLADKLIWKDGRLFRC